MNGTKRIHNAIFRKAVLAGAFAAAGVVLSVVSVPVGPTKCFPFQHTINVLAGIVLGPWWALGAAFTTSLIRNMAGTGSLFAFPGSMFGAFLVGMAAKMLPQKYKICAAAAEPVGTGIIGAWASSLIIAPMIGKSVGFAFLASSFLMSSIPGAIIGAALLWCLRKRIFLGQSIGSIL
ncbi:energy coupling factor transporter S component ThiW [Synergistaceae bacterium OttesenSCG-928-D05]|nr:energy coupling factor transporter S component ThiW [Synergistaceae bacterium OttesenSCG-928-D05]